MDYSTGGATFQLSTKNSISSQIVWMDFRNGVADIYRYDLTTLTESPVCTATNTQQSAALWEDRIVWLDDREQYFYQQIYMYDISTTIEMCLNINSNSVVTPYIWGNWVVWQDDRNGMINSDIYGYDFAAGTEVPICTDTKDQWSPDIWENRIVWADERNGGYDLYMYDLAAGVEIPLHSNKGPMVDLDIWGDRIVWEDSRNASSDIYLYEIGPLTTSTSSSTTSSTTSTTTIICFSGKIYEEESEELELLRSFRDHVLSRTPEGRELIKLYYMWSPVIVKAMEEDEEFKEKLTDMIDGVLLLIEGYVE